MATFRYIYLVHIFVLIASVINVNSRRHPGTKQRIAEKYMMQFGYTHKDARGRFITTKKEFQSSLRRFQKFANLPITGVLDARTIKQMEIPRCGLKDPVITGRFVVHKTKWKKNLLTWRFDGEGRTLERATVLKVLAKGFSMWSEHTKMNFRRISSGSADISVKFLTRKHNDKYPFDGKGGTLAHAFFPRDYDYDRMAGDIHFDNDEDFTYESQYGKNLLWVATHEMGHSLGLEHSDKKFAIMYPYYRGKKRDITLTSDDIAGIQFLYGQKPRRNIACPAGSITAIYYSPAVKLFVSFTDTGKIYFIDKKNGMKYGPVPIKDVFQHARTPTRVDAAYYIKGSDGADKTVLFSGESYYIYKLFSYTSGPHNIHKLHPTHPHMDRNNPLNFAFPSWVKRIDAVMNWYRNGRTYFFSSKYYWRYDRTSLSFDYGYPRLTQEKWTGVAKEVHAAYSGMEQTFFLSGKHIYIIDDWSVKVKQGYPKHVACKFLNCGGKSFSNVCAGKGNVKSATSTNHVARDP